MVFVAKVFLGFLSLSLIALLNLENIDISLKTSIYALLVSIPSWASYIIIESNEENFKSEKVFFIASCITMGLGIYGGLASLTAIFWHFNRISGVIFLILSLIYYLEIVSMFKN